MALSFPRPSGSTFSACPSVASFFGFQKKSMATKAPSPAQSDQNFRDHMIGPRILGWHVVPCLVIYLYIIYIYTYNYIYRYLELLAKNRGQTHRSQVYIPGDSSRRSPRISRT